MRCACIDIGSNTTRLLVADAHDGALTPVAELRAFTQLARACRDGTLAASALAALAEVVAHQARAARGHGTQALRVVATAALRRAANGPAACAALSKAAGVSVELLSAAEEAQLAFAGATGALPAAPAAGSPSGPGGGAPGAPAAAPGSPGGGSPSGPGAAAPGVPAGGLPGLAADVPALVADVGGGSTQLVAGTPAGGPSWSVSLPLGSGDLAAAHLRGDPPSAAELDALRAAVAAALDGLAVPPAERRLAVGGSATSLRRLAGPALDRDRLAQALAALTAEPASAAARRWEIAPERVRVLPAGILVLDALAARLGPLEIACGGLREGVVRALAA